MPALTLCLQIALLEISCFPLAVSAFQAVHPLLHRKPHVDSIIHTNLDCRSGSNSRLGMALSFPPISLQTLNANQVVDVTAVLVGAFFLIGYHLHLYGHEKSGKRTWRSSQADTREKWSKYVRENELWLYAIQTLRNAITAQTFLATTVLSLLTVIGGRLWELIRNMSAVEDGKRIIVTQFVVVAGCMLASAFQFLQSARLMTHAGFMFPVHPEKTSVDKIMRQSENAQWSGLRFLYTSVGVIVWVVGGPKAFFISSILLALFFRKIDLVPEGIVDDDKYDI
jgi:uncharacterized membrane protein